MNYEQFYNTLKDGFNARLLADALQTSEGHLNELRRKPNPKTITEFVAKRFGLKYEDVANVVSEALEVANIQAIYDFATKDKSSKGKEPINLDALDLKYIAEAKIIRNERPTVEVGTKTKLGEVVLIKKIGNAMVYMVNDGKGNITPLGTSEIMENLLNDKKNKEE